MKISDSEYSEERNIGFTMFLCVLFFLFVDKLDILILLII